MFFCSVQYHVLTAVLSGVQVFMILCILWFLVYSQSYRCGESVRRGQAKQREVLVSRWSLWGMFGAKKWWYCSEKLLSFSKKLFALVMGVSVRAGNWWNLLSMVFTVFIIYIGKYGISSKVAAYFLWNHETRVKVELPIAIFLAVFALS